MRKPTFPKVMVSKIKLQKNGDIVETPNENGGNEKSLVRRHYILTSRQIQ